MNILLWVLQVALALHTVMGAVWKFSNSEQSSASLQAMPHALWMSLIGVEFLCAIGLVLPALSKSLAIAVPVAAGIIAAEMLLFTGFHLSSGAKEHGQMIYWLVVAVFCGFMIYGRTALEPFAKA